MTDLALDIKQIKDILHHRYPLLLIDRVDKVTFGKYAEGIKNITVNEEVFNGHFPDNPIFPGVLILEAMAQISALLGAVTIRQEGGEECYHLLAGVDKVRFRKPVVPGDQLVLVSEMIRRKRNLWKFRCYARVGSQSVAEAELLCAASNLTK